MIQPDDQLIDNIKNFELGQVVSTETAPAEMTSLDHKNRIYRQAIVEGYEDILVTVQGGAVVQSGHQGAGLPYHLDFGDLPQGAAAAGVVQVVELVLHPDGVGDIAAHAIDLHLVVPGAAPAATRHYQAPLHQRSLLAMSRAWKILRRVIRLERPDIGSS